MLSKLIVTAVVLFLIGAGAKQAGQQLDFMQNIAKTLVTMTEVNGIKKIVYFDFILECRVSIPLSESGWSEYIRQRMSSDDPLRDTSKDMWITPYTISVSGNSGHTPRPTFTIRSAGPDRQYLTSDDIVAVSKGE